MESSREREEAAESAREPLSHVIEHPFHAVVYIIFMPAHVPSSQRLGLMSLPGSSAKDVSLHVAGEKYRLKF